MRWFTRHGEFCINKIILQLTFALLVKGEKVQNRCTHGCTIGIIILSCLYCSDTLAFLSSICYPGTFLIWKCLT